MGNLNHLFENNRKWANDVLADDADFFKVLSKQQSPKYLWIGCADSRVPANEIVGLRPGELFVHRNVANIVGHTDLNCLSVIQYAVEVLKIEDIIVCGHYGCGGVQAAYRNLTLGLIDNWLRHTQDVMHKNAGILNAITDEAAAVNKLCELNVVEQVVNVCQTTILQQAWESGRTVAVHGWIYGIENGLLRDLRVSIDHSSKISQAYSDAMKIVRG
jgi:carbonic anhydrase